MADYPVSVKKNRALPLKADIYDADGILMTDAELVSPPVVQVWYDDGESEAEDVTDEALPVGDGSEGNQFVFTDDGNWQFNLKTKNYTAPGIYTIFMDSGDATEYVIDPSCETSFVIK
jgi:hypothetical protein